MANKADAAGISPSCEDFSLRTRNLLVRHYPYFWREGINEKMAYSSLDALAVKPLACPAGAGIEHRELGDFYPG